jgi:hypothetical protein
MTHLSSVDNDDLQPLSPLIDENNLSSLMNDSKVLGRNSKINHSDYILAKGGESNYHTHEYLGNSSKRSKVSQMNSNRK